MVKSILSPRAVQGRYLIHATPRRNLESIRLSGLLARKSKGRRKAVWVGVPSKAPWAVLHVVRRHRVPAEEVVFLLVKVPRGRLRKSGAKGLYYTTENIQPSRIVGVVAFDQFSASPLAA